MVAERARAGAGMAALDRRISILDFVGQSWTSWIDKAAVSTPEGEWDNPQLLTISPVIPKRPVWAQEMDLFQRSRPRPPGTNRTTHRVLEPFGFQPPTRFDKPLRS